MNGRLTRVAAILSVLSFATPAFAEASGEDVDTHAFELGAFLSATWLPKGLAVDAGVASDRTVGFGGALTLSYRGPFFLYPFIDLGFYNLAASSIHPVDKTGGISADTIDNSLNAWTFMFGPAVDVGVMRFRLPVGFNRLEISVDGKDFDDDVYAAGFVTGLHVAGSVARTKTFRLNVEGRITYMMYAGSTFFALGISGGADLFTW